MNRSRVRITPLGYIVLSIIILVMLIGIYFIIWSMRNSAGEDPEAMATQSPTPSLAPIDSLVTDTPSIAPISTDTNFETVTPPPVIATTPGASATTTPNSNDTTVRTPSPSEVNGAQDATLSASGVRMRAGPSLSHAILGTYSSGTRLKVYGKSGDFYYIQIVKEGVYGYISAQFVSLGGTPSPNLPSDAIVGTVTASAVALRDKPSLDSNKLGQIAKGDQVVILFKTGEFYYIEVGGKNYYAFAEYIQASTAVPTGTPLP
jgi:uncharacterized protein YraI/nitrogen fixation-related uncharacterized protein